MGIRIENLQQRTSTINDRVDRLSSTINFSDAPKNNSSKSKNSKLKNSSSAKNKQLQNKILLESQNVLGRTTMPKILNSYYHENCSSPPPIHILDNCREPTDKIQNSMKVYTDPDFFFNLWREKIQQQNRLDLQKRRKKRDRDTNKLSRKPSKNEISKPTSKQQTWQMKAKCFTETGMHHQLSNGHMTIAGGSASASLTASSGTHYPKQISDNMSSNANHSPNLPNHVSVSNTNNYLSSTISHIGQGFEK